MMRWIALALLAVWPALAAARTRDVYVIDMEGGQSTLVVAPSGQTMLIDAGWPGQLDNRGRLVRQYDRDADRILKMMKTAGVKRIDYWLHSVISRAAFSVVLTAVWKLSYAT